MDRDWTASFLIRFKNGTCIIILDRKYNIANSSCHFGSYDSISTGTSPKTYYMDLRPSVHIICFGDGPVHILPYDPQCHDMVIVKLIWQRTMQIINYILIVVAI
jgi:hypothetical protein